MLSSEQRAAFGSQARVYARPFLFSFGVSKMIELNDAELELVAGGVTIIFGQNANNLTAASGPDARSIATGLASESFGSGGTVGIGELLGPVLIVTI